jgi:hypothetical protein
MEFAISFPAETQPIRRDYQPASKLIASNAARPLAPFAPHQRIIAGWLNAADAERFSLSPPRPERARSRSRPNLPVVTPRSGPPLIKPNNA